MVPLAELTSADFDMMIALILEGTFLPLRHQLRVMSEGPGGSIVNMSSVLGLRGTPMVPSTRRRSTA